MNRLAFVLSFLLVLPASVAFADTSVTASGNVSATVSQNADENGSAGSDLQIGEQGGADASSSEHARAEEQQKGSDERAASSSERAAAREEMSEPSAESAGEQASTTEEDGKDMGEQHRSVVASVVHSLLADSERDGGIGAEVRAVASSQAASASTTAEAIANVQARNKIWTVLFGTDWKSIGTLRSQIAQTDADTARLQAALSQTTDASVKADLAAQLASLKAEQAKVTAFVDAEEHAFSLFGWFTKLFVSTESTTTATTTAP